VALTLIRPSSSESTNVDLVEDVNLYGENREAKLLAGICTKRCSRPARRDASGDIDSEFCERHHDDQRRYHKSYMERRREMWDAAGWCMSCGDPYRAPDSRWCCVCLVKRGRTGVKVDGENKRDRIAANTTERTTASNLGRTHYHGHGKRGRVSNGQLDDLDLDDATKRLKRAREGLAYADTPEVKELPRIQRLEASRAALSHAYHSVRFVLTVLVRHGEDVSQIAAGLDEDGE
jgi:uncharacterized protein YwbE